jgi:membrane associated rhomboid family serine protease
MLFLPLRDNIRLGRLPIVTIVLVAINVIVYLLEIRHGGSFFGGPSDSVTVRYGAIPYELTHTGSHCAISTVPGPVEGAPSGVHLSCLKGTSGAGQPATWQTVFSSMFMHGSFWQVLGNMFFLAIFGPNVEDASGRLRYLAFYLLGGVAALAVQVLVAPDSTDPTLGASGAIAGVLGGYLLLYPRARVLTLVLIVFFATIVEVPSVALIVFWFVLSLVLGATGLASPIGGAGVGYFANIIGGLVFGLLVIKLFVPADRQAAKGLQPPPRAVY